MLQAQDLPEGKGKDKVQEICMGCHGLEVITGQRASKTGWASIVDYMVSRGAGGTPEELQTIIEYLAKNFGPVMVNVNKAPAKEIETTLELTTKEAEAIVKYRQDHGDFKDFAALSKVADVDAKKLEAKKDSITFN